MEKRIKKKATVTNIMLDEKHRTAINVSAIMSIFFKILLVNVIIIAENWFK